MRLGELLGELLPSGSVLLLDGELGAGKTVLVRGLARGLGVPVDEPVTSPTYALMNQYAGRCPLYHFDLYRLAGGEDLFAIGFEEYLRKDGIVVVEWAERAAPLTFDALRIGLQLGAEENGREFDFTVLGGGPADVLAALAARWTAEVGCESL